MCGYDVICEKEILNEMGAGILADFLRYFEKNNISIEDMSNPLIKLYWNVVEIKNNILGSKYDTMKDMNKITGVFQFVNNFLKEIG